MYWLIIVLIIVLLIIIAMLPVTISGESSRHSGTLGGNFALHWLVLRVSYDFRDRRTEILMGRYRILKKKEKAGSGAKKPAKVKKKPVKRKKAPAKLPDVTYIRLAGPCFWLFRGIIRTVQFKYLKIYTVYGLEDPAYTGILTGFIHALYNSFGPEHDISFDPDFTARVLDWDVKTSFDVIPAMILLPVTRFVTNRRVIALGWRIIRD